MEIVRPFSYNRDKNVAMFATPPAETTTLSLPDIAATTGGMTTQHTQVTVFIDGPAFLSALIVFEYCYVKIFKKFISEICFFN